MKFSEKTCQWIQKEMNRYETKLSAVIPSLYRVQEENGGWVSPACVAALSELMQISESQIYEVLTFYTMFNKKPIGKFHIQVCCNVSCAMNGGRELLEKLKEKFPQDKENPVCTVSRAECLGSCDTAPVVQINREPYIEKAQAESVLDQLNQRLSSS